MGLRQAIGSYGLTRQEIAETVFQGRAKPPVSILPAGVQDYVDLCQMCPSNPDKAKALLKEAGHGLDDPIAFELILNNEAPFFVDAATY